MAVVNTDNHNGDRTLFQIARCDRFIIKLYRYLKTAHK